MAKADTQQNLQQPDDQRYPEGAGDRAVNAYIGKGVTCNGSLTYDGTIRIDGTMEGKLQTTGTLWVGKGAIITAQVRAGRLICQGTLTGDVTARESVLLRAPTVLNGSITTPSLVMEEGVLLNGSVTMPTPTVDDWVEYRPTEASEEPAVHSQILARLWTMEGCESGIPRFI